MLKIYVHLKGGKYMITLVRAAFEVENNTTCVIVFSNGTVVEFSAEL